MDLNSVEMLVIKKLFSAFPNELYELLNDISALTKSMCPLLNMLVNFRGSKLINDGLSSVKNSFVHDSAYIGDFSLIRNSYISEQARIGSHVEINQSIVLSDTIIPHHNYIGYSIIGNRVVMGGNVRTAVKRLDETNPKVLINEFLVISNTIKYGAIIGDDSKLGSSVVLSPMTILGRNVVIEPNMTISGYFPDNAYVKNCDIKRGVNFDSKSD